MQGAAPSASGGGDGGGDHSFWSSLLKWSLAQQENGNVAGVRCRAAAKAEQARLPGGDASLSPLSRISGLVSRDEGDASRP